MRRLQPVLAVCLICASAHDPHPGRDPLLAVLIPLSVVLSSHRFRDSEDVRNITHRAIISENVCPPSYVASDEDGH